MTKYRVLEQLYATDAMYQAGLGAWLDHMLTTGPVAADVVAVSAHWDATDDRTQESIALALGISQPDIVLDRDWKALPARLRASYEAIGAEISALLAE